jgi:hypothetical protein
MCVNSCTPCVLDNLLDQLFRFQIEIVQKQKDINPNISRFRQHLFRFPVILYRKNIKSDYDMRTKYRLRRNDISCGSRTLRKTTLGDKLPRTINIWRFCQYLL